MCLSDLIITANASFGINEAMAIDKKFFTYECSGTASLYFPDFVMKSGDDLVRNLRVIGKKFSNHNCD